jgi:glutaconyl-CoA/methylmalonyl-CoA decarboxylase subunit gamma
MGGRRPPGSHGPLAVTASRLRLTALGVDHDVVVEVAPDELSGIEPGPGPGVPSSIPRLLPPTAEDRIAGRVRYEVSVDGWIIVVTAEPAERAALRERATRLSAAAGHAGTLTLKARIPGRIAHVWVRPGTEVRAGDRLLSIEAMKMENEIRAPHAGIVQSVLVEAGDRVEVGAELVVVG